MLYEPTVFKSYFSFFRNSHISAYRNQRNPSKNVAINAGSKRSRTQLHKGAIEFADSTDFYTYRGINLHSVVLNWDWKVYFDEIERFKRERIN